MFGVRVLSDKRAAKPPIPTVPNVPSPPYVAGWRWGGHGLGTRALGLALLKRYVGFPLHSRDAKHRRVTDQIRALVKSFQWRWNAGHDLLPQLRQKLWRRACKKKGVMKDGLLVHPKKTFSQQVAQKNHESQWKYVLTL